MVRGGSKKRKGPSEPENGRIQMQAESIFSCRIESSKILTDVLTCLVDSNRKDQICYFEATQELLTITVTGRSKSTQARITLKADIFDLFSCECTKHSNATNQENEVEGEQGATNISISFVVQLQVLLGCLSLHGHSQSSESTMASLYYSTNKAILKLTLEEPGVLTVCDIQTLNLDDEDNPSLFLAFQESEEVAQIIIKSEPLKDAMQELMEMTDCPLVTVRIIQELSVSLKFISRGSASSCEIDFPKHCDAFVTFRCDKEGEWSYLSHSLLLGMKALGVASETFIRVNEAGMMCVQHKMETTNKVAFLDFLMLSSYNFDLNTN